MFLFDFVSPGFMWLVIAIIFACLELVIPGMFACIAFSAGAVGACFASLFVDNLPLQATIFFASSVLSFVIIRLQLIQAKLSEVETRKLTTNVQALIQHQTGFARVGGEIWSCKNIETGTLAEGSRALVLRVQGSTLILKEK